VPRISREAIVRSVATVEKGWLVPVHVPSLPPLNWILLRRRQRHPQKPGLRVDGVRLRHRALYSHGPHLCARRDLCPNRSRVRKPYPRWQGHQFRQHLRRTRNHAADGAALRLTRSRGCHHPGNEERWHFQSEKVHHRYQRHLGAHWRYLYRFQRDHIRAAFLSVERTARDMCHAAPVLRKSAPRRRPSGAVVYSPHIGG
jgi:hypothetical protein